MKEAPVLTEMSLGFWRGDQQIDDVSFKSRGSQVQPLEMHVFDLVLEAISLTYYTTDHRGWVFPTNHLPNTPTTMRPTDHRGWVFPTNHLPITPTTVCPTENVPFANTVNESRF